MTMTRRTPSLTVLPNPLRWTYPKVPDGPVRSVRLEHDLRVPSEERAARRTMAASLFPGVRDAPLSMEFIDSVLLAHAPEPTPRYLSVLIPVRGAHAELRFTLKCLKMHTFVPCEVVIACAESEAAAVEALWDEVAVNADIDGVLVTTPEPQGFPANVNLARSVATGSTLVVLNSDAYVPRLWTTPIFETLNEPGVVAVGPIAQLRIAGLDTRRMKSPGLVNAATQAAFAHLMRTVGPMKEAQRLIGFCLALRARDFDRVGGFFEGYGLGNWDDDDLCTKLRFLGELRFAPLVVAHAVSASFRALPNADATYARLLADNRAIFEDRWGWALPLLPPLNFSTIMVEGKA